MKHLFLLAVCIFFSMAYGQGPDSVRYTLPEQSVTGTRSEFLWIENPTSISLIGSADQPLNRGLGLTDNLLLVPGLVSTSRFGTDDIRLSMRGMGSRSNSGVRGVRVLYDGIPESEPDGQTRLEGIEVGNLDRVEVLRGAGSSLYGNAAGGVVNLRTAECFPHTGIRMDAQGGGFGFFKMKLSAGTGSTTTDSAISASFDLRNNEFSMSQGLSGEGGAVSISHTKFDGWRKHSEYEGQIVSGSWSVKATAASRLRSVFYFTNVTAQLPGPLNKAEFDANSDDAAPKFLLYDVGRITRKGRLGLIYEHQYSSSVFVTMTPYAAVKKLDRSRENGQYQTITRYILGGALQGQWRKDFSEDYETEIIAGMDQQLQDGPVAFYTNLGGTPSDTLLAQEQERQWGQGYFLQCDLERKKHWGILLGVRYDHVRFNDDFLNDPTPTAVLDEEAVTPRLGLRYHLNDKMVAFGSVVGGFETPTLSEVDAKLTDDELKSQKTLTFEAGLRGDHYFGSLLTHGEISAYRMNVSHAIVPYTLDGKTYFANAKEAVHQGVEVSTRLTKSGWGYLGLAASIGQFSFTDFKTDTADFNDKMVPGVSPDMFSTILRWTPREFFFAEFNVKASGSAFVDNANQEDLKAKGWFVLGAVFGGKLPVRFMSASWHVGIQNLTDEKYVSFIQANDNKGRFYESGMPQTFFGGLSIGTSGL